MFRDTHHGKPCTYCQRPMDRRCPRLQPTRDHVIPKVHNGRTIVISCIQCNGIKDDMMPDAWEAFMAMHPRWWTLSKMELRTIRRGIPSSAPVVRMRPNKRQGMRVGPVIVPPGLVYGDA